jgi:hypothetical protein
MLLKFILVMVLYQDIQRKLQEEIVVAAVKGGGLSDRKDREELPYLECVMKELYRWVLVYFKTLTRSHASVRWNPPVPLGMPHRLIDDDIFDGYLIPKGSTVMANIESVKP